MQDFYRNIKFAFYLHNILQFIFCDNKFSMIINMFDICILGSANLDHFLMVPHIPKPGETIEARDSV